MANNDVGDSALPMDSGVPAPQEARYTPQQRSLALAAVERYGKAGARKVLEAQWGAHVPSEWTLWNWGRRSHDSTEEHQQFWTEYDQQLRDRLRAQIEPRIYSTLEAFDRALEENDSSGAQRFAISAGILIDKLVPPVKAGAGAPLASEARAVQILAVAPAEIPGSRRDLETGDVIEGESREVPDSR